MGESLGSGKKSSSPETETWSGFQLPIPKLDLGFSCRYRNQVSVVHYLIASRFNNPKFQNCEWLFSLFVACLTVATELFGRTFTVRFFLQNSELFLHIIFYANGILSYFCFNQWTICTQRYHWSLGNIAKRIPTE